MSLAITIFSWVKGEKWDWVMTPISGLTFLVFLYKGWGLAITDHELSRETLYLLIVYMSSAGQCGHFHGQISFAFIMILISYMCYPAMLVHISLSYKVKLYNSEEWLKQSLLSYAPVQLLNMCLVGIVCYF